MSQAGEAAGGGGGRAGVGSAPAQPSPKASARTASRAPNRPVRNQPGPPAAAAASDGNTGGQSKLDRILARLDDLVLRMKAVEDGQKSLEGGQKALEGGQKALQEGQKALEEGQKALEEGQKALEEGQNALTKEMKVHRNKQTTRWRMLNLRSLLAVLSQAERCPHPAVDSITVPTASSNTSNASPRGEPTTLDRDQCMQNYAERVLFTDFLFRGTDFFTVSKSCMVNAHVLGKAQIRRNAARKHSLSRSLQRMLEDVVVEESGRNRRNIMRMVKGFEDAMDAQMFTFVPDFDNLNASAWKIHVFDKNFEVDVTMVNRGKPGNRVAAAAVTAEPQSDTNLTMQQSHSPPRLIFKLGGLHGKPVHFQGSVSVRCLAIRSLLAYDHHHELTEDHFDRFYQWAEKLGKLRPAARAEPGSMVLLASWLTAIESPSDDGAYMDRPAAASEDDGD